jgi:hypothetical protein
MVNSTAVTNEYASASMGSHIDDGESPNAVDRDGMRGAPAVIVTDGLFG